MKGKGKPKGAKHHVEHHGSKHVEHHHYKKGGKVAKAEGEKPKHRMDKRARGGKVMSPKSPLSGAEPSKMRPGFAEGKPDKEDD